MVKRLSDQLMQHVYSGGFIHCKDIHRGTCVNQAGRKFVSVFKEAIKFYSILHGIPVLMFKYRKLMQDPKATVNLTVKNIFRSCLFIALYVTTFQYMLCFTKNTRQKIDRWNVVMACFTCSFAIYFEAKSRTHEIVMQTNYSNFTVSDEPWRSKVSQVQVFYMVPRMFESIYRLLKQRGMARYIKNAEVLVFALCMAFIMFCYENKPKMIKPAYLSLLKRFFGTN